MSPFSPPLLPKRVDINVNTRVQRQKKRWGKRHRDGQMVFPFRIRKVIAFHFFFFFFFLLPSCHSIPQHSRPPKHRFTRQPAPTDPYRVSKGTLTAYSTVFQ